MVPFDAGGNLVELDEWGMANGLDDVVEIH
jgi:hypothetical protein